MLVGKPAPGASHAALYLVGDQQRVVHARQFVRGFGKFPAYRTDAALALQKLKSDSADGGIKFAYQIGDIIKLHELHAGDHGSKRRAIFFLVRSGQRAERPAVKGMLQGKDPPLWLSALRAIGASIGPRQL